MKYTRAQKAQARVEAQAQLASPTTGSVSPIPPTDLSPIFFHREYLPPYGFLSQWFLSTFHDPSAGTTYNCAEQRMMHARALLCGDTLSARLILASANPGEQKALGRKVKGWKAKAKEWEKMKFEVVVQGNMLKFGGEGWLRERLLATGERELVEASPGDRVWGVGFGEAEAEGRRGEWGMNLLGKALMTVRERIRGGGGGVG